jgi:hypothetical protein
MYGWFCFFCGGLIVKLGFRGLMYGFNEWLWGWQGRVNEVPGRSVRINHATMSTGLAALGIGRGGL